MQAVEERARAHLSLTDVLNPGPVSGTHPQHVTPKRLNIFSTRWEKACPHCSRVTASLYLTAAHLT